ncbi:hypothetical protein AMECASPLE_031951 [Ameca splendens]|uniref:Uncharacterized protein n=1 Tax=Ameca splendens TaxID=208324 RepID=A0ABV0YHJ0_9TELE
MRMMKNRCGTWRQDMLTAESECWVCSATCGERTAKVRSPRTTGCPKRRASCGLPCRSRSPLFCFSDFCNPLHSPLPE